MSTADRQSLLSHAVRAGRVGRWRHLARELLATPDSAAASGALSSLTLRIEGHVAFIEHGAQGTPLPLGLRDATREIAVVRIAEGVFSTLPASHAREELLRAAGDIAARIELHAPLSSEGTYVGRLAIDVPRRALRALGIAVAEPGDRFATASTHAFFDDEALIREGTKAGLAFVHRRGAWIAFERTSAVREENAAPFPLELLRALAVIQDAERLRLRKSTEEAVAAMRARGQGEQARGPIGRARLRRAIGWADAFFPAGGNCLRRVLIELGLDSGAASEPLAFGLDVGGTGHVAFADAEELRFDVVFLLKNAVDATAMQRR